MVSVLEAKSNNGYTPLHLAAQHDRCEAAHVLIEELGADEGAMGNDGRTPLSLAHD